MRLFYFLPLLFVCLNNANGQELVSKTIDINPLYWPTDSTKVIELKIEITKAVSTATDIELVIDPLTLSNNPSLINNTVTIPAGKKEVSVFSTHS